MDPVTHILLGVTTAQLGFRQRIGRDASWVAAMAATVPDWDVWAAPLLTLSGFEVDDISALTIHRGPTHSLLTCAAVALPIALAWWWARRALRRRERPDAEHLTTAKPPPALGLLYLCVLAAVGCHPLLDLCTSYGTQILWPLTSRRYAIDAVGIIDFIYTPILLLTLLACFIARKIARSPAAKATLIIAWTGLVLSTGYIAAGKVLGYLAAESPPKALNHCRRHAYPQVGTIFLWRVTTEDENAWYFARANMLHPRPWGPDDFRPVRKPDNQWVRRARELPEVETFDWFAGGQLRAVYERRDDLHVVEFQDMRYAVRPDSPEGLWGVRAMFDESGRLLGVHRVSHFWPRGGIAQAAREVWREIWKP